MHKLSRKVIYMVLFGILLLTSTAFTGMKAADYIDPITGMEFVAIPAGAFIMGDNQNNLARPEHEVTIQAFMFGRYEVTFDQYEKYCRDTDKPVPHDNGWGTAGRPLTNISWYDANNFTKWLSAKTDKKFRLPSEAEWEYAARGGATTKYPWGDEIGRNNANCDGCGSKWDMKMTAPVGSFSPNGYGLHDMIGNVYEWCLDTDSDDYLGAPTDGSAWIVSKNRETSIYRGASWRQPVSEMAITQRCASASNSAGDQTGFRLVLEY